MRGSPDAVVGGYRSARKFHPPRVNQDEPPSRMTFVRLILCTLEASAAILYHIPNGGAGDFLTPYSKCNIPDQIT
jgi:hypothetical protein